MIKTNACFGPLVSSGGGPYVACLNPVSARLESEASAGHDGNVDFGQISSMDASRSTFSRSLLLLEISAQDWTDKDTIRHAVRI